MALGCNGVTSKDLAIIAHLQSPYDDMGDDSYRGVIRLELEHYRDEQPDFPLSELLSPLQFAEAREAASRCWIE
jgi:hypothetical protein|tara:strand:+ start:178 stop:399 length:222 start_codon:yes stop_codon:yes gene_type:complete